MPRKGPVKPRDIKGEPLYSNRLLAKVINRAMKDGKKAIAQKQVYMAMDKIKEQGEDPAKVFTAAIENIKPAMEVRPRRVGGAAYQVPMPVRGDRKESLAIRWLIAASRSRSSSEFKTFADKLAVELIDASKGEGGAIKKKMEVEKIAEANKAFSHFRW